MPIKHVALTRCPSTEEKSMNQPKLPLFALHHPSLRKSDGLLRVFEDIHNHIYANDGLSPEQAFEEVIKILFLKIFDEKSGKMEFKISAPEYERIQSERSDMDFIRRFRNLRTDTFNSLPDLFKKGDDVNLKSGTFGFAVNKLQHIDLLESSNDVKGLAFQKFVHSSQRTGRGQFFTPEQIINLCVEIVQPRENEAILDPACGSGGFLSSALRYVAANAPARLKKFAGENIYGLEINRTVARIAKMRMILDESGLANIVQSDALLDWSSLDREINRSGGKNVGTYQNFFDVILTNPPFGTQGKITDKSILRNFDLGYKWRKSDSGYVRSDARLNGQVPEILFIERCLQFLKPGGRMAIVLPNGDFENSSLVHLRYYIQKTADILAVIKLPQETFLPSGTGVKTSVLFLRKKDEGGEKREKVFFAQITRLGYSGNKKGTLIYKKDRRGNVLKTPDGAPRVDEDITEVISAYLNYRADGGLKDRQNAFLVDKADVDCSRFDFEFYKPSCRETEKKLLKSGARRLGDLADIKKSASAKLKQKDLLVRYVELSDISVQYNEIVNSTEQFVHDLPSRASYDIREGDIITAVAGNSIGTDKHASAYVTGYYEGCICTNGFRVLSVNEEKLNPFYFLYFLRSKYFLDQVHRLRTGAAIPSLLDSDLLNILVLLPPMSEQNRIGRVIREGFDERMRYQDSLRRIDPPVI